MLTQGYIFGLSIMNDPRLRRALKSKVLARYAKDPDTRIVDELGLRHGIARVDIAVVNGIIHGYELKSDKDNLKRLPHQIQIYGSVLDKVTLSQQVPHTRPKRRTEQMSWECRI